MVWLYHAKLDFKFYQYVSALSVLRFIKPCAILFWYDGQEPVGKFWDQLKRKAQQAKIHMHFLKIKAPTTIQGKSLAFKEHQSDIIRINVLKECGWIYLDSDVLILKSLRTLMCYDLVLGKQDKRRLCNNFIMSVKDAPFLEKWIYEYENDYRKDWGYNNIKMPMKLSRKYKYMVHIEESSINRPSWEEDEVKQLYSEGYIYDWSQNYAIHLWHTVVGTYDYESLYFRNTTVGQVFRHVLSGFE